MADVEKDGADAAKRDFAAGVLRYKWTGHGGFGAKDFCRLVQESLGMIVDDFGICMVTEDQIAFARGYNRTVSEHLIAVHGHDVIDDAMAEARALFQERYDRYVESLDLEKHTK